MSEEAPRQEAPRPFVYSWPFLLASAVVLPPVGLALLLMRRDLDAPLKAVGSLLIVLVGSLYVYLLFGSNSRPNTEAHFDALERHRAEQRQAAPPAEAAAAAPVADAAAAPPAEGQPAAPAQSLVAPLSSRALTPAASPRRTAS